MSESEKEEFELDIDLENIDFDLDDSIFSLPQHPIIEELRKYLASHTRISTEAKKKIQKFIEDIDQEIIKELSKIFNLVIQHGKIKTIDVELAEFCIKFLIPHLGDLIKILFKENE